jgi:hypothetical protein
MILKREVYSSAFTFSPSLRLADSEGYLEHKAIRASYIIAVKPSQQVLNLQNIIFSEFAAVQDTNIILYRRRKNIE